MTGSRRASSSTILTTSRIRAGVASEEPPNLRTLMWDGGAHARRRRGCSREDRVGVLVVVLIDETVDRRVLGLERLENGQQLRGLQDGVALGVKVEELDVAVALADRDVLPRDRADAGAVEVRHLFEVQQDPRATAMAEGVHQLDEWRDAVLENQPALEVQDDHATHLTLGNLHASIAATILASPLQARHESPKSP